jgi:hypothetical protein
MDLSKIVGVASLVFAGLLGYWLVTPSAALNADPANSMVLIVMSLIFAGAGVFLIFYSYMFNAEEGD